MSLQTIKTNYKVEEITYNGVKSVKIYGLDNFDTEQVFDCGQCFRFMPITTCDGSYGVGGVAFGRYVEFIQNGDCLVIRNSDIKEYEDVWYHFLSLDIDYFNVKKCLKSAVNKEVFDKATELGHGIRILNQEPWECVCSFIISQNNNIPRIRKIISAMCEKYGEPIAFEGNTYYSFPKPEVLVSVGVDAIFDLKTGFRAKYIYDAAQKVVNGEINLKDIYNLDYQKGLEILCSIKGIGPKVASCALLFAFEKYNAFPVDVWVKKILAKYFPEGLDIDSLGEYAGIAQQYLFYYERYVVSNS